MCLSGKENILSRSHFLRCCSGLLAFARIVLCLPGAYCCHYGPRYKLGCRAQCSIYPFTPPPSAMRASPHLGHHERHLYCLNTEERSLARLQSEQPERALEILFRDGNQTVDKWEKERLFEKKRTINVYSGNFVGMTSVGWVLPRHLLAVPEEILHVGGQCNAVGLFQALWRSMRATSSRIHVEGRLG